MMRWLCALIIVAGASQPATLPTPGFHHLHLNSSSPKVGDHRAVMIEGPSREAIELIEIRLSGRREPGTGLRELSSRIPSQRA